MSRPNAGTDEFEMGHKGQARVERGAKIMEEGHFQNRMIRRGREGGPENAGEHRRTQERWARRRC